MHFITTRRGALTGVLAAIGVGMSALLIGCGGGGGGAATPPAGSASGRSYSFSNSTQAVSISVDTANRMTIYARDATALPTGAGAQGTIAPNGQFFSQSSDGSVQFSGTVGSGGSTVAGTVQTGGRTVISFSAAAVSGQATQAVIASASYISSGAQPGNVLLTVDAHGMGTFWAATTQGSAGGGLVTLQPDGAFATADNATTGTLTANGANSQIQIGSLSGRADPQTIAVNAVSRAKWTFLVYLNGANNLDEFGPLNVNQMEQVGSTSNVNIVVQWKRANCFDCGTPDWVGTRRYFVTKDANTSTIGSQLVQDMGSHVDMGDWRTLLGFITWTQQYYPADHYALVIWNHGAGWRPTRAGNRLQPVPPRSVSIDDDTGNEIETWQLPQALAVTPQMDMVIFDASLMQMLEVAYEIRNSTPVVVGSEESPPGEGYVYNTFLADLVANPSMTNRDIGADIVTKTLQSYGTAGNNTQSAVDTSKLQTVADALNNLGNALQRHTSDSAALAAQARSNAENYVYPENKDLWDYANRIKAGTQATDLSSAAAGVQSAVQGAVFAEAHGSQHANSHGLAIYVPAPGTYLTSYSNLALSRVTSWPRWLQNQPQ